MELQKLLCLETVVGVQLAFGAEADVVQVATEVS
jgi:hypothetical protein